VLYRAAVTKFRGELLNGALNMREFYGSGKSLQILPLISKTVRDMPVVTTSIHRKS